MNTAAADALSPSYLKLELCMKGVRLDASARTHAVEICAPCAGDDIGSGLELVLSDDVWVSALIDDTPQIATPFLLSSSGDEFTLQRGGTRVEVRLIPQPMFYRRATTQGTPMWQVGKAYGSCIAINPAAACGYSLHGAPCRLCLEGTAPDLGTVFTASPQEVTEVVGAAFEEGVAEFVYFNLGYAEGEDGGIEFLEPYIRTIKRHFDTLIAVQLHPPNTNAWIDRTYAMGVDALSYSVEVHDAERFRRYCRGRAERFGRQRYDDALRYAATIFPSGTVWSELVVGLEPPASTRQGIDSLTAMGVVPVLALARSWPRPALEADLAVEAIAPIYAHLFHAVRNAKINMGWLRDLSFAVTPLEARFFAGDEARMAVAMQQFYRSRIGNIAARNLARLRRRLRVRRVSDSFDSSHL
jgi:hypothetical protein